MAPVIEHGDDCKFFVTLRMSTAQLVRELRGPAQTRVKQLPKKREFELFEWNEFHSGFELVDIVKL